MLNLLIFAGCVVVAFASVWLATRPLAKPRPLKNDDSDDELQRSFHHGRWA